MKLPFATLAIAACLVVPFTAQASESDPLTRAAQAKLKAALGERASALTVTVNQGVADIQGWALQAQDAEVARHAVSQVPGITRTHSSGVHTWMATSRL